MPRATDPAAPAGARPVDLLPRPAASPQQGHGAGGRGRSGRARTYRGSPRAIAAMMAASCAQARATASRQRRCRRAWQPQHRQARFCVSHDHARRAGRTRGGGRRAMGLGPGRSAGRVERRHAGIVRAEAGAEESAGLVAHSAFAQARQKVLTPWGRARFARTPRAASSRRSPRSGGHHSSRMQVMRPKPLSSQLPRPNPRNPPTTSAAIAMAMALIHTRSHSRFT